MVERSDDCEKEDSQATNQSKEQLFSHPDLGILVSYVMSK